MDFLMIFTDFLRETWILTSEMAPYLLLGFLMAGLLRVFFNEEWVRRHLGQKGFRQIVKAVLIGIPLPLCSCGVIPVAAGIRRQGGQRGAVAAFTASTPQTGVDSIIATAGMMGWVFAVVRIVIAFINGITAGVVVERLDEEQGTGDAGQGTSDEGCGCHSGSEHDCCHGETDSCCENSSESCCHTEDRAPSRPEDDTEVVPPQDGKQRACCCHEENSQQSPASPGFSHAPFISRLRTGLRFGLVTLPGDLFGALVVGLLIAGMIASLAPADLFASLPVGRFGIYVAMTLISLPLYVCSTGSIPMAFTFLQAGMSPGAVLIFLIAGPASNTATVTSLWKLIGGKATVGYILSIIATCWVVAIIIDYSGISLMIGEAVHHHEMSINLFQQAMASLLLLILLWAKFGRRRR